MIQITPSGSHVEDVIIGIDLGTTNSLVAICKGRVPQVLRDRAGASLVPSIIYWSDEAAAPVVGQHAKRFKITDAPHTAFSVKRYIGKGKSDLKGHVSNLVDTSLSTDQNIVIRLGTRTFSAIELSAEILRKLKILAEESLGTQVSKAVITVPAYFNDSQRTATKTAGTLAGLDVVRIVNEPTAAALAYGLDKKRNGLIVVYDLGGGTFDVSVLRLHDGIFDVLATNGDTELGGDDFDRLLFDLFYAQILRQWSNGSGPASLSSQLNEDLNFKAQLLELSEQIKIRLSFEAKVSEEFVWKGKEARLSVTRDEFNILAQNLVDRTVQRTVSALKDAGIEKEKVDDVIMVGGSTRLPIVQENLRKFFGKPLNTSLNPDEVVALGAAVQADILSGQNQDMVLLDIVPLSLGIETYGGTVSKLVHRNTKIPAMAKETFTTHVDGQKNVLIHVLQGERELATDCRSLARFDLQGLPPMPAGLPKIEVIFLIDANGMLIVRAKEAHTGVEAAVEVKPSYGLTDEQVEKMLADSYEFAQTDMVARQLVDTRVEAEGVLKAAEKLLNEGQQLAGQEFLRPVEEQVLRVRNLLSGDDYLTIRAELDKLEETAKPLAEKVMNQALKEAVQNKNADDFLKN